MTVSPFDTFKTYTAPQSYSQQYNTAQANKANIENNVLKGVLLNTYIKDNSKKDVVDFSDISSSLLIPDKTKPKSFEKKEPEEVFDIKKALKPIVVAAGITAAAVATISIAMRGYSKAMAKEVGLVRPGDLARNINIVEEPHFAMYQVLRDPSKNKILGLIGVGIMSAVTMCAKNFVDGVKAVWIKKQNCDIEHDLQENLINVETEVFSGKLATVNEILANTTKYFQDTLKGNSEAHSPNFKSYVNFKGNPEKEENKEENKKEDTKKFPINKNILMVIGGAIGIFAIVAALYKNWEKTKGNLSEYIRRCEHAEITSKFEKASNLDKEAAIKETSDLIKLTNVQDVTKIKEKLSKIKGITPEEVDNAVKSIRSSQIYAQAPEALGGISEKIQYYCYINEERGHLYNWIMNPENKFNKYLFLSFCAISGSGYIAHAAADALKDVAVSKENAKSELGLRKKLISTDINNFKAKKLSAINPMIDSYNAQLKKGKSKEELKVLAENILRDIKNGPPFVYS